MHCTFVSYIVYHVKYIATNIKKLCQHKPWNKMVKKGSIIPDFLGGDVLALL